MARVRRFFLYTDASGKRRKLDIQSPFLYREIVEDSTIDFPKNFWFDMLSVRRQAIEGSMGAMDACFFAAPPAKQSEAARFALGKMDERVKLLRKGIQPDRCWPPAQIMKFGYEFWEWYEVAASVLGVPKLPEAA